jgi:cytochrome c
MGYRNTIVNRLRPFAVMAAMAGMAVPALAAPSYPKPTAAGCKTELTDADFKVTTLVSHATNSETSEPLKMAFDMDAAGNVDVYFVQRFGLLRKYNAATKATVNLAKFTVPTGSSDGLIGIALDPAFKSNHWIYLYYSTNADWRVGRFTLNGETLDMASEKVLITIAEKASSQHTGGAMQFDWDGNLWITVGDNNTSSSAANTNDLRGKILRIHPTPDGKYIVPAGNLFPEGTAKTRPEIYVMGSRNPYSITLDARRKAVTWGDVGPDFGGISEEHDLTTKPGNFGWPYYAGDNIKLGGGGTADAPINTDGGNTGIANLPPAIPAVDSYKQACSVTGPVYYYGSFPGAAGKMPDHFDGKWFVGDFSRDLVVALTLDEAGTKILARDTVFTKIKLNGFLDLQVGPDGNIYVANYAGYRSTSDATGILKISYTGTCPVGIAPSAKASLRPLLETRGALVSVLSAGSHVLEVRDLAGRTVARFQGRGEAVYDLSGLGRSGVFLLNLDADQGKWTGKILKP